jgi:hypothetical protein
MASIMVCDAQPISVGVSDVQKVSNVHLEGDGRKDLRKT